jgi:hypothetical protein
VSTHLLFLGSMLALALAGAAVTLLRYARDAHVGRQLRHAAGSDAAARVAIDDVRMARELRERIERQREQAARYPNVIRMHSRVRP